MKVLIDDGHGENTPGKCSLDGRLKEWVYTREIADRVVAGLRHRGEEVERIVKGDVDIPLSTRCRRVNKIHQESGGNAILISIHCSIAALGIDWLSVHGWSVSVSNNASASSRCSATSLVESAIMQSVLVRQPMPRQLFWIQSLAICWDTICPSVLTENSFQDNKEDAEFPSSPEGKQQVIQIHIDGILNHSKTIEL